MPDAEQYARDVEAWVAAGSPKDSVPVLGPTRDPEPWECRQHPDERWPQRMSSCNWNPRPEYEQDRDRYPWVVAHG